MSAPESHISTPAVEMLVERLCRARARARAQAHQSLGTFSQRAAQRAAHGTHPSKSKLHHVNAGHSAASASSRPRDGGCAGEARTREDIRLPQEQRSEDRRKGGLTTYEYDLYGNLLRVDLPDGRAIEYEVDGAGRRVGRRELDADGFEISFRGWIYRDLLRPIAEVDAFGDVVARYVYSDGDGAAQNGVYQLSTRLGANQDTSLPFARSNVPESIEFLDPGTGLVIQRLQLSTNQVGSVQLVADADTGDVVQRIEYDEFGRAVFDSNPGVQPFGFAGGLYDEDSGLVRFGARDYSPDVGRWIARDAVRFAQEANGYLYNLGDTVNGWDPTGYCGASATAGSFGDFARNYNDLREANTVGGDKYFHCKANCQASKRGCEYLAKEISDAREWVDENLKDDPREACEADQDANEHGREEAVKDRNVDCRKACNSYRPGGLPDQY